MRRILRASIRTAFAFTTASDPRPRNHHERDRPGTYSPSSKLLEAIVGGDWKMYEKRSLRSLFRLPALSGGPRASRGGDDISKYYFDLPGAPQKPAKNVQYGPAPRFATRRGWGRHQYVRLTQSLARVAGRDGADGRDPHLQKKFGGAWKHVHFTARRGVRSVATGCGLG